MSLQVLVVDDSFAMRTLITDLLLSDPGITVVDSAKSGAEAIKKLSRMKPDCMTLDLVMPDEDGLAVLKRVMRDHPLPVVILSALAKKDAEITFRCLAAGAVSFVPKPSGELSLDIEKIKPQLLETVKAVSQVSARKLKPLRPHRLKGPKRPRTGLHKIIVMGASTGGPQTVEAILASLPEDFPAPLLVVQHMPSPFFTQSLAERLNQNCPLRVKLARDQESVEEGMVYLAPPGFHLSLERPPSHTIRDSPIFSLTPDESEPLTPSIDCTMQSAARVYGEDAIGVILSGMGNDGTQGMKAIKVRGGTTIAQDENALIFGMPKSVIEAGWADQVLPLEAIAEAMMELATQVERKT